MGENIKQLGCWQRESSRSSHRGPLSQWLTVKPPLCEENSVRSSEASGSWKLNNPQWPHWAGRPGSDGHNRRDTEGPGLQQTP